jgi:hypothetical protein
MTPVRRRLAYSASISLLMECKENPNLAGQWWLMPVILVTQEKEIRKIAV